MRNTDKVASDLFAEIWPEGPPASELLVFEAVPPEKRQEVLHRLELAWRGEQGVRWDALAPTTNLKRAAFFNLRRGWRRHGIAGVIPHGAQKARAVAAPAEHPLRTSARALLRNDGGRSRNVDIARSLMGFGEDFHRRDLANLQRAERLVQHERRALALDHDYLIDAYGRGLLLDLTAVSIMLDDANPAPAVVAVVIETASGLVLGSEIGHRSDVVALQRAAVKMAAEFLCAFRADRLIEEGEQADLHFTVPPSVDADNIPLAGIRAVVRNLNLGMPGGFNYGMALVQLIGPRIGRMVLAPRSTLAIDGIEYAKTRMIQFLELDQARVAWQREVLRHNGPVLDALSATGLINGAGIEAGAMASVLEAVDSALAAASVVPSQSSDR